MSQLLGQAVVVRSLLQEVALCTLWRAPNALRANLPSPSCQRVEFAMRIDGAFSVATSRRAPLVQTLPLNFHVRGEVGSQPGATRF